MENDLELTSVIFCVDKGFQYSCIALLNCHIPWNASWDLPVLHPVHSLASPTPTPLSYTYRHASRKFTGNLRVAYTQVRFRGLMNRHKERRYKRTSFLYRSYIEIL